MTSIATRTGDAGTTSLLYGQRVSKDHPQIEAVGTFDELNVALGATKPLLTDPVVQALITGLQHNLVALMGELACAESDVARYADSKFAKITEDDVTKIDAAVAALETRGLKFDGWATPGKTALGSAFDIARVTARRAERRLCALPAQGRNVRPELRHFTNRLADLLWLLAREAEQ
jgi:cob(I)alamin adenosyltransferase